jgi:hypothetical protein
MSWSNHLRARPRRMLAGVGCLVAVVAASAAFSAPAMAATTQCSFVRAYYASPQISGNLLGQVCWNGARAWDPNPYGTSLTYGVGPQYATDFPVQGHWDYVFNSGGTELIDGYVLFYDQANPAVGHFYLVLAIQCTPAGRCTSQAYLSSVGP